MKISLWQQFSSNHSASFSVVGTFESAEWAQEVARELTQMFVEIHRWDEEPTIDESPSIILQKLRYGESVGNSWMLDRQHVRRAVTVIDQHVLITDNPGYSNFDNTGYALFRIMQKLGGTVIVAAETGGDVEANIRCIVPDKETIQRIHNELVEEKTSYASIRYRKHKDLHVASKISHEEQKLLLEGIYISSYGFNGLFKWIDFLEHFQCSDIEVQVRQTFRFNEDEVSGWIPFSRLTVRRPLWAFFPWSGTTPKPAAKTALAQFESPDAANQAAAQVRDILHTVIQWIEANPERATWVWEAFWERLSPPEIALQAQYGVNWRYSMVEWLHPIIRLRPAEDIITVISSTLFLENKRDTWVGVEPFHELLKHFGATQLILESTLFDFELKLPSGVLSTEQSQHIATLIQQTDETVLPAWYRYYGGVAQDDVWWQDGEAAFAQQRLGEMYHEEVQELWRNRHSEHGTNELIRQIYEQAIPHITQTPYAATYYRIQDMRFIYGEIIPQKNGLLLKNMWCTAQGVLALAAWLCSFGGSVTITARWAEAKAHWTEATKEHHLEIPFSPEAVNHPKTVSDD